MKTEKLGDHTIKDAFTFINRYYYIENKSINYSNALGQHMNDGLLKFYNIINEIIDENEIDLLTKLSKHPNKTLSTDEWCILEQLIEKLKKDKNFTILPQTLTDEQIEIVKQTIKYIFDYCENKNIKLSTKYMDGLLKEVYHGNNSDLFEFTINYNNYDYRYTIRKINNRIVFKIKLRNNKEYKINLYDKTDFLNVLNCMYNDK